MRKFSLIFLVVICIVACGKNKGAAPLPAPPNYVDMPYLSAAISGINFSTDSPTVAIIGYPHDSLKQDISIMANKIIGGVGYTLKFYITNFTGVNTYAISPPQTSVTYYVNGTRHYAQAGQIVIATDSNNVITGTFGFMADTLMAAKGAFNVAL
jgi:hypothetical protein